jgi:hypothetical protein
VRSARIPKSKKATSTRRSEFDPRGVHARAEAQNLFLQAIRDCELESPPRNPKAGRLCRALTELKGIPLQRFQSLYNYTHRGLSYNLLSWNLFARKWTEENTAGWTRVFNDYGRLYGHETPIPNLMNNISPAQFFAWLDLREAISEWAGKWNLASWDDDDPWFFDNTLFTLYLWCYEPTARDDLFLPFMSSAINSLPVQDLRNTVTLELEADLSIESRAEAEERIDKQLKEARNNFLSQLEALEKGRGAAKSRDIRADHAFEMLVRYVVQGWSNETIRAAFRYKNIEDVSRSNNRTAKLIGLTLPNRRGRPRKKQ